MSWQALLLPISRLQTDLSSDNSELTVELYRSAVNFIIFIAKVKHLWYNNINIIERVVFMLNKNAYIKFTEAELGSKLERPVLVAAVAENMSEKSNKPFIKFTLKDGFSDITAIMFDMTAAVLTQNGITPGCVADAVLSVGEYQGAKNFKALSISPCRDTHIEPADFTKLPPLGLEMMYDEICSLIQSASDDCGGKYAPLSGLALKILAEKKQEYMSSSAAVSMHHNLRGGLLYHSYRMVKAADALCGIYSVLNRELMLCGTALHDIGKIWEYATTATGEASFTREGVLYGHLYMGAEYVRSVARTDNYDPERVRMLVHMILSHHGTQEWGAVSCPATPEAFALHYIDNIDAKIYMCEDAYETLPGGGLTEKKPFGLDNRLYKPEYLESMEEDKE